MTISVLENQENLGSSKYKHITTQEVINRIEESLNITDIKIKKTKKFLGKHIVEMMTDISIGYDSFLTVILINSYNAKNAFQFRLGVYRLICSNGVIAGRDYFKERIIHMGDTEEQLEKVLERLPIVADMLEKDILRASNQILNPQDRFKLAFRAIRMRGVPSKSQIDFREFLKPLRGGDRNPDKWSVFNIAQEKLTRTGFHVFENGKRKKIKAIKGIQSSNELNQKLFSLVA